MVSIIMPVYNREEKVKKAIQSVIDQTYTDWELIIVDDCSTDNTYKKVTEIKDPRIKLLQLKRNSGPAAARNEGIKASSGKYISLLDSDDYYEPLFLKESIKILNNSGPEIGFMWTGARFISEHFQKEIAWTPGKKGSPYLSFLHSLQIGTNTGITFKSEVFKKCGYFDSSLPAAEDTEFFLRVSKVFDYTRSPKVLINIQRDDNDRLSKNFQKVARAYNSFLPQHFEEINKDNFLKRKFYYKMMWLNYNLGKKKLARTFYYKIPKKDTFSNIKYFLVYKLYEVFPLQQAIKIHQYFSSPDHD